MYSSLAEQGSVYAQSNLGYMYDTGRGTPQDYAEALKWYRLAAKRRDVNAQINLGFMYGKGHAVLQDHIEAHKWFNLAASGAPDEETRNIAIENRDLAAKLMTPSQIAEAQKLAKQWDKAHPR